MGLVESPEGHELRWFRGESKSSHVRDKNRLRSAEFPTTLTQSYIQPRPEFPKPPRIAFRALLRPDYICILITRVKD